MWNWIFFLFQWKEKLRRNFLSSQFSNFLSQFFLPGLWMKIDVCCNDGCNAFLSVCGRAFWCAAAGEKILRELFLPVERNSRKNARKKMFLTWDEMKILLFPLERAPLISSRAGLALFSFCLHGFFPFPFHPRFRNWVLERKLKILFLLA